MFNYTLDFKNINFRDNPHLYQIGKGEQGVLLVEPYKSEILPHWRFKTPDIARASSEKIYQLFLEYKEQQDFVGMDMARKFLQMGYTRSRRYANHKSAERPIRQAKGEGLRGAISKGESGRSAGIPVTRGTQEPDGGGIGDGGTESICPAVW